MTGEQDPTRVAHFRIVGRLGAGGMGVVYRAEDEKLRRTVALKLLPDATGNEERRQRFLREARSAAAITHPNVAVVHAVDEADGRVYIAMELVEGESLRARLERGPLDLATAREWATQMARGLAAAHDKGIVHRDLKPENVMITPAGVVKLLDFGLAKAAAEGPRSGKMEVALAKTATLVTSDEGRVMGTPEYMSPEQAMGEPLDVRSDVFSFGIVLYEMLAGARPFAGASTGAVLVAIARDPVPPLRTRAPHVDELTADLVARCLAKAPEARFANATEILVALGERISSRATTRSQPEVTPVARTANSGTRASGRARLTAGFLLVLAVAAVGAWRLVRRAPPVAAPAASAPPATASTAPMSRSSSPEAQRLFEEAIQSFARDLGHERDLLDRAVEVDPTFGGAYLRLWMLPGISADEGTRFRRQVIALDATLSDRDRALAQALEASDLAHVRWSHDGDYLPFRAWDAGAGSDALDAYLERYPDDDMAWLLRQDGSDATLERASSHRPTLPILRRVRAMLAPDDRHGLQILDDCLARFPYAVDCLRYEGDLLSDVGECAKAEASTRRLLDLAPTDGRAHTLLAGLLAARGQPLAAVREALGDPAAARVDATYLSPASLLLLWTGDFDEAARSSKELAHRIPASRSELEHFPPWATAALALHEEGNPAGAADVAVEYLALRSAWNGPCPSCEAMMLGAAARGGRMSAQAAAEGLDRAFQADVAMGTTTGASWAETYAFSAWTPAEARAALARLDGLGIESPPRWFGGSVTKTYLLAGRADPIRAKVEYLAKGCVIENPFLATRELLGLGELEEQEGKTALACARYARVLGLWGHARPRSIAADEARAHATKLGCAP